MRSLALLLALLAVGPQPSDAFFGNLKSKLTQIQDTVKQHQKKQREDVAAFELASGAIHTADQDPLGKAATHVPELELSHAHTGSARTAVITLPPGMEAGQWVDAVWAKDQDGKVVHLKRFDEDPGTPHPGTKFTLTKTTTGVTAYAHSPAGIWKSATMSAPAVEL